MSMDHILGVALSAFTVLVLLAMLFSFLSNECNFKKIQSYQIVTFLSFLFFTIFASHTTINFIISIISSSTQSFNNKWCVSGYLEMIAFGIGKLFAYHFFLFRLHQVFEGSVYSVRTWKLKVISALVTFPIISQSVLGCFWAITNVKSIQKHSDQLTVQINDFSDCTDYGVSIKTRATLTIFVINVALYLLTQLIYSVFILRTFLGKLLLLSMPSKPLQNGRDSAAFSCDLLDIAMKTTNCVILLVASTLLLVIKSGGKLPVYWMNIEGILTCLSMYLSFRFSSKSYNILFAPCHLWLHKPCVRCCFCCCLKYRLPKNVQLEHHVSAHRDNKQVANIEGIGVVDNVSSPSNSDKSDIELQIK